MKTRQKVTIIFTVNTELIPDHTIVKQDQVEHFFNSSSGTFHDPQDFPRIICKEILHKLEAYKPEIEETIVREIKKES